MFQNVVVIGLRVTRENRAYRSNVGELTINIFNGNGNTVQFSESDIISCGTESDGKIFTWFHYGIQRY